MRSIQLLTIATLTLACSAESPETPGPSPSSGGSPGNATGGSAGMSTNTGGASPSSGGAPSSGGMTMAAGGSTGGLATGGSASGGTANGGSVTMGGASALGGVSGMSGASGMAGGGAGAQGGAAPMGGAAGASSGAGGGAGDSGNVAKALDNLRIDDPCTGTPSTAAGSTCNHVMLTNNQFKASKEGTILGTAGTTYDVTLRIRGVVEPTIIEGGMRPDTSTFSYNNGMWRKIPYTVGGTMKDPTYQVWRISVSSPKQDYYLNDYGATAHNIFKLDYQVTIPMAANSTVTFSVFDSNERQIDNYEKYALDGIPGSMNYGQFMQINVVSAVPH